VERSKLSEVYASTNAHLPGRYECL
jgi:hypothetical protein